MVDVTRALDVESVVAAEDMTRGSATKNDSAAATRE